MKNTILKWKNYLLGTFWFIPLSLIFFAFLLSYLSLELDKYIDSGKFINLPQSLSGSVDGYRTILSTIGGSMMTIAGIVFSSTLVALTMTASQFGSRILKNFMKNPINQIVLGAYIATFTYCLVILRDVRPDDYISYTPDISVLIAMILGIGNIILLVFFIHHTATSLQAEYIVSHIGNEMLENIQKARPSEKFSSIQISNKDTAKQEYKKYDTHKKLTSHIYGYIEYLDIEKLKKIAIKNDLIIKFYKKTGSFILKNEYIAKVYSKNGKHIQNDIINSIKDTVFMGKSRTRFQDVNFSIKQLVEIALRALSPGINDPHTAISCIDEFAKALCFFLEKDINTNYIFDEQQNLRVEINNFSFHDIVDSSLGTIRQYASSSPDVLKHLYNTIISLATVGKIIKANKEHIKILEKERKNIEHTINEHIPLKYDLKYVQNGEIN